MSRAILTDYINCHTVQTMQHFILTSRYGVCEDYTYGRWCNIL